MKSFLHCVAAILAFMSIFNTDLYAQDSFNAAPKMDNWLNAGFGFSNFGVSAGLSYSFASENHLYTIRGVHNEEIKIFGTDPVNTVWDIGLLYGLQHKTPHSLISISTGIALVGGVKRVYQSTVTDTGWYYGGYTGEKFLTAGLPVETQLFWRPHKVFGIGLCGFANLNSQKSFAGGMLSLQIGNF